MRACANGCDSGVTKQTLYVVRHAIAQNRESWSAPDDERSLTPEGEAQARRLADLLGGRHIDRVLSSPSLRCRQTVMPLARHLGLKVENAPLLYEGTEADTALRSLLDLGRPSVAGCTHGDVIGGMLRILARKSLLDEGNAKLKKGSTWVLDAEEGQILRARYLPPP